ncbi:ABC transporter permease [Metaplanococcus flavidus]|uniref:Transport permease protein n=1 Tax=Metaplanococcus flavidus TaxID=569883 RepID=A0ABW3LHC5_9BACL
MLATQLKYDLLMFSREIFYLVFTIVVPPLSYIVLGQLFQEQTYAGNLNYAQTYTPAFILLITFTVIFFAFGFDQVSHRTTGVEKRIQLTPVSKNILLLSGIIRSLIITSLGYALICLIGILVYSLNFELAGFLHSYAVFILINASLLLIASAIYSFFLNDKSALVFSIVIFQVVMLTGGFAMPVERMPAFVQTIADLNPLYHMNKIFTAVWNNQLHFDSSTYLAIGYIVFLSVLSLFILQNKNKRKY